MKQPNDSYKIKSTYDDEYILTIGAFLFFHKV